MEGTCVLSHSGQLALLGPNPCLIYFKSPFQKLPQPSKSILCVLGEPWDQLLFGHNARAGRGVETHNTLTRASH